MLLSDGQNWQKPLLIIHLIGMVMFRIHRFLSLCFAVLLAGGLFIILPNVAKAQSAPVQFEADRVETNEDNGILTATGNVIIIQDGSELRANQVIYNRKTQSAIATGQVILTAADGSIHMSERFELSDNFKKIFAEPMISEMSDGSRFTAEMANGNVDLAVEMDTSSFTPCDCDYENGEDPIWDLRATKTTHNKQTATIIHENVRMHVFGLPVFYMPVLAHPDWTVDRRTGFLAPSIRYSTSQGSTLSIPYYKTLGPSADVELRPYLFQHRGQALHTIYREKTDQSDLKVNLYTADVATFKKTRESVAAIDATHQTQIGDGWNVETRLVRTSQDTFLRRYKFLSDYNLKSTVKADRIKQDRYYLVEASDLQGVRAEDTPDKEPTILPHIFYEQYQPGFRPSQVIRTELSALQLDNDDGHDLVRWSGDIAIEEQFSLLGGQFDTEFGVMTSAYDIQKKKDDAHHDGEIGQANPYVSLDWRAAAATVSELGTVMLEPRAKLTFIGGADRTQEVPNRDSSDFRLDEANLFLTQRHQGKDYVLPGTRADIGLSALANDTIIGEVNAFAGISRRLSGDTAEGLTTGNNRNYSDYVASISIQPSENLSLSWAGRADSHDFELNEGRTTLDWRYQATSLTLEHAQLSKAHFSAETADREALSVAVTQGLPDGWEVKASQNWDLSNGKTRRDKSRFTLAWTGGFQDCLTLSLDYQRDSTTDRDIPRNDEIFLVLNFKYLGAISQSDFQD